jgi:cell division protein FtsQ
VANLQAMASFARPRTRVVLGITVLLVVLAALALSLRSSSLVRVEQVTVNGIQGPQAEQIRRALVAEGMDMTTLNVSESSLLSAVAQYPVVRSLRTETDFPHGLRIVVNAYEPVAVLRASGGGLTAVAGDGTLLRGSSTRDLPIVGVRSTPGGTRLGRGETLGAVRLLAAAPRPLRQRIGRVYRGPRGLAATMSNGPKLYFGGAAQLEAKWGAAAQVLAHRTSRGASYVDLRIPERPVAGGLQPRPLDSEPQL